MKVITSICFLLVLTFAHGQDTIYLNRDYQEIEAGKAEYYRVEETKGAGEKEVIRRTYWITNQIKSERSFIEKKDQLIPEGLQKFWYEGGQLYYTENFKKGKRHGDLIAFWEDGSKRRHDHFKKGKFKSGKIWNRQGEEIEHFPVMVPATFPGGQKAIAAYLKANIPPAPKSQKKGTEVRVVVSIRINKEGQVSEIDLIDKAPPWYHAVTFHALSTMPRWNPGKHMGEPVNVSYTLPVIFRK